MATNNLNSSFEALSNKHTSEQNNTGTNSCKNIVIIHHKDTLGRDLPQGIVVNVYDSTGKVHEGIIDRHGKSYHGRGAAPSGFANPQVTCGEISWQLKRTPAIFAGEKESASAEGGYDTGICEKDTVNRHLSESDENFSKNLSDGYVLIKAEADGDVFTSDEPRFQLSNPLKVQAYWQKGSYECHIYATYLPPPMLLNLRFLQDCDKRVRDRQLYEMMAQIRADGGAVTLFVHGYNVPLGKTGRFPTYEETVQMGKVTPDTPKPPYVTPVSTDEMQIPWLHYGRDEMLNIIEGKGKKADKPTYEEYDKRFNGVKALNWVPHVEYYLNLAASGKDKLDKFVDWEKYSRIIGVTWSGSVASELQFFLSEIYANESGRTLAKVLKRFIDAGININILTHSLGARVALSALNVLGDFDGAYDEKIDNLILWEPAVADNAFTDTYTRNMNPIAMEIFPFAHKVPQQITVLYSTEDGVVAGDTKCWDGEITGLVGGAYTKKYNKFFGLFTKGTAPIKDFFRTNGTQVIYAEYARIYKIRQKFHCDRLGGDRDIASECFTIQVNRQEIRRVIEAEAAALSAEGGISDKLYYLKPWSCFRRFKQDDPVQKQILEHIIDILTYIVENHWQVDDVSIRPPLGARGGFVFGSGKRCGRE
ncbi:hypothetical protein SA3033_03475 [Aggregatibacter actinomycetemcomitans serotype d str. SA3033]|uniref:Alpha/beta hydrolase n=4 Tax=Aggregatibacter actinomycetemcomitans TaxID=714 RepID=A0A5D0EK63_AGGAC|nr:alpha/beta hydrolase [Aggregatibacter actinomycetemcomitans]AFI87160.1 hypothetical protein D7S_01398 [Aggregatibacter actinomycetemcomitans D7S-1]AMQ94263.1 hypothetical protein ACT75_06805 [Aggregatibacter actinomycetemcomitans]KND84911.1 hypothetical protein H5P1_0206270 [Aggregatibacter actinomycetemcomitans serotype a str. H5P1]KOE64481.1 hypothetical protein I63B_0308645 [Aggregatibacter actinomycetemcomitans serotype d str. I63B]KYK84326.1 hypothetical protein SA3033_03475 [Aggregati